MMKAEIGPQFPISKSIPQNDVKVSFNQNEAHIDKYPSMVNLERQNKVSKEIPSILDIKEIKKD